MSRKGNRNERIAWKARNPPRGPLGYEFEEAPNGRWSIYYDDAAIAEGGLDEPLDDVVRSAVVRLRELADRLEACVSSKDGA